MFQIDDKFLSELGLGALPQSEKDKMKAHIYETLEMQVGMRLASGMTEAQLDEFEGFMSGDVTKATDYLDRLNPNWRQDPTYINSIQNEQQVAQQQGRVANPDAVTSEYAALKWLETNFPNYKQVVAEELDKLKDEIRQAAPHIVAESSGGQPPAPAA
jgi:hypothetical protein